MIRLRQGCGDRLILEGPAERGVEQAAAMQVADLPAIPTAAEDEFVRLR